MTDRDTNRERVLECIRMHPEGIDDDEVSDEARVHPRQQVYQIANLLASEGLIVRKSVVKPGKRRKIHNFPSNGEPFQPDLGKGVNTPRWRKRLAALVAATGKGESEILDQALEEYAHTLLKKGIE